MIATADIIRQTCAELIEYGDRESWVKARSGPPWPIGASDATKLAEGEHCAVWREKKLGYREEGGDFLALGHDLEPAIGQAARRKFGWELIPFPQTSTLRHPNFDWIRCTPDFIRVDGGRWEVVNVKNVSVNNPRFKDYRDGLVAESHYLGSMWEQLVTGTKRSWIVALIGGAEVKEFPIDADEAVQRGLFKECATFRAKYLIGDGEPEPDASDVTARALADRRDYERRSKVYLADVAPEADAAAARIAERSDRMAKDAEADARDRNILRQAMKGTEIAVASCGSVCKWTKNGSLKIGA